MKEENLNQLKETFYRQSKKRPLLAKLRMFLIRLLAGNMGVALNLQVYLEKKGKDIVSPSVTSRYSDKGHLSSNNTYHI